MDTRSILAIVIFLIAYVLFVLLPTRRSLVAVGAALALIVTRAVGVGEALHGINWNVMGIFVGTLVAADIFLESRFPAYLAEHIVGRSPNTAWALLFICALTGFISAFVENVATVLIIAPIALSLASKLRISPVNIMIGLAISSNLQGTATLIGDPPSMLLGGYAKMTFMDFFFFHGRPSIFFAVELGALSSFIVLYFVFRRHTEKPAITYTETVKSWAPVTFLVLLIVALAVSSSFDKGFSYLAGTLCILFAVIMVVWEKHFHKGWSMKNFRNLDWDTTFFLMGIFVIVESLTATGWIDRTASFLSHRLGPNVFLSYTAIVVLAIVVSAFVDNVPFLAAMLPVASALARDLNTEPHLFLFGLLIGASLGGNITPIGASANVVACGMLRKQGHTVTFSQFGKIAIPFTIAAVVPAYILVWIIWGP